MADLFLRATCGNQSGFDMGEFTVHSEEMFHACPWAEHDCF